MVTVELLQTVHRLVVFYGMRALQNVKSEVYCTALFGVIHAVVAGR